MTCINNMCISAADGNWLHLLTKQSMDDAMELLSFVGLESKREEEAGSLSFGQQKLLELAMALISRPQMLLVDEPSIGLEPRYIDMVFEILSDLRDSEERTILMVEQNAKKELSFADIGYVLAAGELALAGKGDELL